jgi:hypothetical protein
LQGHEKIASALSILKRLTQLVECSEAKVQIRNHFRITRVRLADFAGLARQKRRTGYCDEEQHQRGTEDDRHYLIVHPSE